MATLTNNDIARAIYLSSKDKNHVEQSIFFKRVIQFLDRKRLLSKTKDILFSLDKIINEEEGRVVARVTSKGELSEKIKKELEHILAKRYGAKEISIVSNFDEKLLGGFKIEVNDEVIDLTLKNKIEKLQEYLTKSI
ncbi:MAG: F0F1 ATP synthase subunit delta [bacterium]